MAKRNLVVVESAAKARTIEKFLGRDYAVRACLGHVRDLPKSKLGVDTEHNFAPAYVVTPDKKDVVTRLRREAKDADAVYLATDPDREGEAIAWHLVSAIGLRDKPVHRIEFHEVTRDAVLRAVNQPRGIDLKRVDAQQARRVLDRLVGYKISPLLWRKVRPGLSAGRVQSVAVRLIVDREREREAFVPVEYWSLEAELAKQAADAQPFKAALAERNGEKIELKTGEQTGRIISDLEGAGYRVRDVRRREQQRNPAAPFTTSTLQQEASRKLGFTARRTMSVAQQLYEGVDLAGESVGLITYMRTDSVTVAETAIAEARRVIGAKYGKEMLPDRPRTHRTKSRLAQEAHEAIRPTSAQRDPERVRASLTPDQARLYELIWKRFVASQMASAIFDVTTVDVDAVRDGGATYTFRANGSVLRFAGFLSVYLEGRDDGEADEEGRQRLPELAAGEQLDLLRLIPEQHFTQPPPRYSEATLVKALEERGIGRPSTYAPILSTIQDRGYVEKESNRFKPTDLGLLVNDLLVGHFSAIVDVDFTATLEEKLDDIATGERPWVPVVREFYDPFEATLQRAQSEIEHVNKAAEVTDERCDKCGRPMAIKLGRFGRFLSCTGFPECKNAKPLGQEETPSEPSDEVCETCGKPMLVKVGRFGRFLSCSDYPTCKTTRPILVKIGVPCPSCGGELVEKKARSGRVFYGCANYPACSWVSWQRPLSEPCEICGGIRVPLSGERIHCLGCDGPLPTRERGRSGGRQRATRAAGRRRSAPGRVKVGKSRSLKSVARASRAS
ncbi:MAG TPA: type I DNA topoisomerase [Chloroflexota bacterium]|nr:type I DNA topoisomerase [Chloroflexota bacterium]